MMWIPVTERTPTHIYSVLGFITKGPLVVSDERGMRDIVSYFPDENAWKVSMGQEDVVVEVSHWMDLPGNPMTREWWLEDCAARFRWANCAPDAAQQMALAEFTNRCRIEPMDDSPMEEVVFWPDPTEAADDAMREWDHDGDDA